MPEGTWTITWLPALLLMLVLLGLLNLLALLWLAWRTARGPETAQALGAPIERLEREMREEIVRSARSARADLGTFQQMLMGQSGDAARTQTEQIEAFRTQLGVMQQQIDGSLRRSSERLVDQLQRLNETHERRHTELRASVEERLSALQAGNEKKLDQMRATVDEKLHATLEQRLGESFRQVADRLEQVHRGLGDMQALARDVGSLNRVLTNVKSRGVYGEVQLASLLEQVLTPEQYGANVETVPGSGARVEFAIRLPGRTAAGEEPRPVWLPIDAKFPREDYERLLDAQERADAKAADLAAAALESRLRLEARTIREKYVATPHTTDFAILFVPTESLYAELLRRPGLAEALQREHRIVLAGPTTLLATLNSLQMGFRTLALERRSAEVWQVLGAVKTEFQKFGDILARTRKKLQEASDTIDSAETRSRAMQRQLRAVEALPEPQARAVLPGLEAGEPRSAEDDRSGG